MSKGVQSWGYTWWDGSLSKEFGSWGRDSRLRQSGTAVQCGGLTAEPKEAWELPGSVEGAGLS